MPDAADRPGQHHAVDRRVSRSGWVSRSCGSASSTTSAPGARSRRPPACWTGWSFGATWRIEKRCSFRPTTGATYFKPAVKAMIELCTSPRAARDLPRLRQRQRDPAGLHRDRAWTRTIRWRPRPDLDAVELRRHTGTAGFCGNSDIRVWESGDREPIRREVLRKLNAARAAATSSSRTTPSRATSPGTPTTTSSNWSANTAATRIELGEFNESLEAPRDHAQPAARIALHFGRRVLPRPSATRRRSRSRAGPGRPTGSRRRHFAGSCCRSSVPC